MTIVIVVVSLVSLFTIISVSAGYKPENFKDRKMAQPGIFVFNEKKEMIFKYVKEGEGPWGRPLPGNLFSIIAAHVKAAGEGPISAIPNEKIKDLPVQDKVYYRIPH
mmetsp:Transcript_17933/g.25113  ORF Transcript_17933/g.25113 Transcript_17933/m.25113 type:complete len:107 (+) Transcript_17933:498-818(+)